MAYATVNDVSVTLGRPISESSEIAQVNAWLARVESRIRRRIPSIDTLAEDFAYRDVLIGVEVDVVVRRILNPEGKANERIDDYSYGLTDSAKASDLWPLDREWDELTPARPRGAFSIRPRFGS